MRVLCARNHGAISNPRRTVGPGTTLAMACLPKACKLLSYCVWVTLVTPRYLQITKPSSQQIQPSSKHDILLQSGMRQATNVDPFTLAATYASRLLHVANYAVLHICQVHDV